MKRQKKTLILVIIPLIPLLLSTTIPYVLGTKLSLNKQYYVSNSKKMLFVTLERENQYTIFADTGLDWSYLNGYYKSSLKISETPYMITGYTVKCDDETGEIIMHFIPSKTGDHYIQIINSEYSFDIIIFSGKLYLETGRTVEFFDATYLSVLIGPSIILFLVVGFYLTKVGRKQPREKKQKAVKEIKYPNSKANDDI